MIQRVLHLVPYDTQGGVETAVRSVPASWNGNSGSVNFTRGYLARKTPVEFHSQDWHGSFESENDPRAHWQLLRFALAAKPDLVVASLWRCVPVLLALKVRRPQVKSVIFLHCAIDVHFADRLLHRAAMNMVDEIWADCATTLNTRVSPRLHPRAHVLSFLSERPSSGERTSLIARGKVVPKFVFWGRLQYQKNLPRTLDVFAAIRQRLPDATLDIIGPDRGELSTLKAKISELNLAESVRFVGPLSHKDLLSRVQSYNFYLQTSRYEGMAMSVVEAMANGLVPVTTAVGEIPRYCHDGETGIFVTEPAETATRVMDVVLQTTRYLEMSSRAAACWENVSVFSDDYKSACDRLLSHVSEDVVQRERN